MACADHNILPAIELVRYWRIVTGPPLYTCQRVVPVFASSAIRLPELSAVNTIPPLCLKCRRSLSRGLDHVPTRPSLFQYRAPSVSSATKLTSIPGKSLGSMRGVSEIKRVGLTCTDVDSISLRTEARSHPVRRALHIGLYQCAHGRGLCPAFATGRPLSSVPVDQLIGMYGTLRRDLPLIRSRTKKYPLREA